MLIKLFFFFFFFFFFFISTTIFLPLQASSHVCKNQVVCPPFNSPPPFPFSFVPGCGHPLFQLKCQEASAAGAAVKTTTISINNLSYALVSYAPNATSLTITPAPTTAAAQRRRSSPEICASPTTLSSLNDSPISFSKPFRVSASSCSRLAALRPCPHHALPNCTRCSWQCSLIKNPAHLIHQCAAAAPHNGGDYRPSCQGDVLGVLDGVLKLGFEVSWDEDDGGDGQDSYFSGCTSCRSNNGLCGFNSSHPNKPFLCFPSRQQPTMVVKQKSLTKTTILAAIFVVLLFVVALTSFIIVLRFKSVAAAKLRAEEEEEADPTIIYLESHRSTNKLPPIFTYEELESSTRNFDPKVKLGDGGFGAVYLGQLSDGRSVAVKHLHKHKHPSTKPFCNEILILSSINHPNLVKLHGYCTDPRGLLLVYDYIPNGTLADHLHGGRRRKGAPFLNWSTRLEIAVQIASAVEYLHFSVVPAVVHRDITSSNIFVESDMRAKLGDFGLSRLLLSPSEEEATTKRCGARNSSDAGGVWTGPKGTPGYLDPDYYASFRLNEKSDVYSFGVVLLELVTGMRAVDGNREKRDVNLVDVVVPRIHKGLLCEVVDSVLVVDCGRSMEGVGRVAELAFRCVAAEKDDRPDMKEVVAELRRIKGMMGRGGGAVLRGLSSNSTSNVVVPHGIV